MDRLECPVLQPHFNLSEPVNSAAILAPLSKTAGGWGLCRKTEVKENLSVFEDKIDPHYQEILNALTDGVVKREQPGIAAIGLAPYREAWRPSVTVRI